MASPLIPILAAALGAVVLMGCSREAKTAVVTTGAPGKPAEPIRVYHDFGTLDLGTKKTHDFEIPVPEHPEGDVIVHDSFHGDCSCAIGLLKLVDADGQTDRAVYGLPAEQRVVHPGEKILLRLTLDTKGKEAVDIPRTPSRGRVGFQLVTGEFARYETVFVDFHYGIRSPIKVSPVAHVDFGKLPLCSKFHQVLELTNNVPGTELKFGKPHASPRSVTARLEQKDDRAVLHITVTPNDESNEIRAVRGVVALSTGLDSYTDLKIPVTGTFVGVIEYEPAETISFDVFDFRTTKERFVNLIDHDNSRPPEFVMHDFRDNNGNDISRHFDVRFQRLSGRKVRVIVKYLGTMGGISLRGWLSLAKPGDTEPVGRIRLIGHNSQK